MRLHHVNVVVPEGRTQDVVPFYELLGLVRVARPGEGVGRPEGAWFDFPDGRTQLHVSERTGERHPEQHFAVSLDDLDAVVEALTGAGHPWRPRPTIDGARRGVTADPTGNTVELVAAVGRFA